jgi:hypothetical protein
MTCADVLDAMMECDPADLQEASEHPIAIHVRECARCRAVASSLTRGVSLLVPAAGHALDLARRRRTRVRAVAIAALPIAAGFVLMVLARGRPSETVSPVVSGVPPVVPSVAAPAAVPAATRVVAVVPAPKRAKSVADKPAAAVTVAQRAVEDASIVDTPPLDLPLSAPDSMPPSVRVTPMSGQRVAILKTSDPKTTVVWIY